MARCDSVPGIVKSSLGSPRRPTPARATPTSTASHAPSTNRRRRKQKPPMAYRYFDIRFTSGYIGEGEMLSRSFPSGGSLMRRSAVLRCELSHWTSVVAVIAVLVCFGFYGGARASASGVDTSGALPYEGLNRTYVLHVPPGVERPTGLVINLHGAGMTAGEQAALTNYNAVADQHGFAVVYPDGIDLSWADGRGASTPDRQGVDD